MPTTEEILRQNLNDEQFKAATDTNREILTLACAGSGKSRTLAFRIAWLIAEQNADPEGIVAFTFTEKAADSIKLRVSQALTACGLDTNFLGRMYIGTIHSYCQYLLGRVDARYRQFEVLDDNRLKLYLIEKYPILQIHNLRDGRGGRRPRYFETINQVYRAWSLHNEELISLENIEAEDPELGGVLRQLREGLERDQFLDFSLMQRLAVEALQAGDEGAVSAVRELQHLLVDEYQDINPIQNSLISFLHQNSDSLFVVGDDDQSIYGWRGADVTRIQNFATVTFPDATSHTIGTNYRSTPLIVRSADRFVHEELGAQRIAKNPQALETDHPAEFRNLWFDTRENEADWVVSKIQELLGTRYVESDGTVRGLTPADFAILMRSTRTAETGGNPPRHVPYSSRLEANGISFSLEAGGGLFDRPHVQLLRRAFDIFRDGQPDRDTIVEYYNQEVLPIFPKADLNKLTQVFAAWGRNIHAPIRPGSPRRRIYPQNLVFELLEAFSVAITNLDDGVWQDLGVFSRIIQDVEAVYPSVDSTARFESILNFLNVIAEGGYDTSNSPILHRPDAVTVTTVHQMKGLEFPVVFVVDIENQRFPGRRRSYDGWLPENLIREALDRGAYQGTREEEARLFYTALTRAERFLYVTGCALGPGWKRARSQSPFVAHLTEEAIITDDNAPTAGLAPETPARRIESANLPTSYSDVKYYLQCPKDYHYRKIFGFSPAIPDLFGFGMTVHASIGKLHQKFNNEPPTTEQASELASDMFHLKHVQPSNDPQNRPGPYERAQARASELVSGYVENFATDFQQKRQDEARFEIPVEGAVVSGAIDLMIEEDEEGNIIDACVIDFKTIEGGDAPEENQDLEWTELSLQVQLYAKAARDVLGKLTNQGFVHLLKDGQRMEIPANEAAIEAAVANIEWAVEKITEGDFPMRPFNEKCEVCDFKQICPMQPQQFSTDTQPPEILIPGANSSQVVRAFREFDEEFDGLE